MTVDLNVSDHLEINFYSNIVMNVTEAVASGRAETVDIALIQMRSRA